MLKSEKDVTQQNNKEFDSQGDQGKLTPKVHCPVFGKRKPLCLAPRHHGDAGSVQSEQPKHHFGPAQPMKSLQLLRVLLRPGDNGWPIIPVISRSTPMSTRSRLCTPMSTCVYQVVKHFLTNFGISLNVMFIISLSAFETMLPYWPTLPSAPPSPPERSRPPCISCCLGRWASTPCLRPPRPSADTPPANELPPDHLSIENQRLFSEPLTWREKTCSSQKWDVL
eukprot:bmy_11193T0